MFKTSNSPVIRRIHPLNAGILALALGCSSPLWSQTSAHATAGTPSGASSPVIYPAKGQSAPQQDKDKYQCHGWARDQSGFDPLQPTPLTGTSLATTQGAGTNGITTVNTAAAGTGSPASAGSSAGGMVKNAGLGAAVGELVRGDPVRGAAIGVVGGAVRQTIGQKQAAQKEAQKQTEAQKQAQQQAQLQAQQQAARAQQKSTFDRAFGACMEARGYTVK